MAVVDPDYVCDMAALIRFIRDLSHEMERTPNAYENIKSSNLLEGAASWLEDAQTADTSIMGEDGWRFIARLIAAGLMYE